MASDSKKWERLGELIKREHERGQGSLLKKIAEYQNLGPSVAERLGKLFAQEQRREKSSPGNKLAEKSLPTVIERKSTESSPLSVVFDPLQWERKLFDPKTWEPIFDRLNREHPPVQFEIVKRPTGKNSLAPEQQQKVAKADALANPNDYLSIAEIAQHWGVSRGTVYNWLRAAGAEVLDFAPRGKRGRKAVLLKTVLEIDKRHTKRLR
jgi:hypothetical protein